MRIKKKFLEREIEKVPSYKKPKIFYEQYLIPSWLATEILWIAETIYGDIHGLKVLDLGCGTGRLAIGAALLGADYVVGLDIDIEALIIAYNFLRREYSWLSNIEFICADIGTFSIRHNFKFDTIIQNPPFGVHRKGYDVFFLENAIRLGNVIYSIHKKSTRDFLLEYLHKKFKCNVIILSSVKIPIPPIYPFHQKRRYLVEVDVYRIEKV